MHQCTPAHVNDLQTDRQQLGKPADRVGEISMLRTTAMALHLHPKPLHLGTNGTRQRPEGLVAKHAFIFAQMPVQRAGVPWPRQPAALRRAESPHKRGAVPCPRNPGCVPPRSPKLNSPIHFVQFDRTIRTSRLAVAQEFPARSASSCQGNIYTCTDGRFLLSGLCQSRSPVHRRLS